MARAIVLLSGGLDSAVAAICAKKEDGFDSLLAVSFDYGQKNSCEIEAAEKVAGFLGIEFRKYSLTELEIFRDIVKVSALASTSDIDIPKDRIDTQRKGISVTYVPGRNIIFLVLVCSLAESLGISDIYVGTSAIDYRESSKSGAPDGRPEFINSFMHTINLGTKAGVEGTPFSIHTPLINMTKVQIIKKGLSLGMDYSLTLTCFDPDSQGRSCGKCHPCQYRLKGFKDAGISDPILYFS